MPVPSFNLARDERDLILRRHVWLPNYWANTIGTDFWFVGAPQNLLTGSKPLTLSDFGWTTTTNVYTAGSGANFIAKTNEITPTGTMSLFAPTAASSLLLSPAIFGDYNHAHAAAESMGKTQLPNYLVIDILARFSVNSASEVKSGWGLSKGGGSGGLTDADKIAFIYTDSTNFLIRSSAGGSSATGATAVDTAFHNFRIVLDSAAALVRWWIDGVGQPTIALPTAKFPACYEVAQDATNNVRVGKTHIYYAWRLPPDPAIF